MFACLMNYLTAELPHITDKLSERKGNKLPNPWATAAHFRKLIVDDFF